MMAFEADVVSVEWKPIKIVSLYNYKGIGQRTKCNNYRVLVKRVGKNICRVSVNRLQ